MKNLKAKDVMTNHVLAVSPDWSVEHLAEFLVQNSISGAPVTSHDGKLLGVVSLTDLVRHQTVPVSNPPPRARHDYYLDDTEREYEDDELLSFRIQSDSRTMVADIMTPLIFDVAENATVQKVADRMIRGRIHRVFVTREKKVVGIITALDMLKAVRDQ